MSRSNPYKLKPRTTRATAQIVCEGFTEEAFCKHLKSIYARDCGVCVSIFNARGGSPDDIIQLALRRKSYDRTVVFFDADKPLSDKAKKKALSARYQLVVSAPCVEGLLLSLLNLPVPQSTEACKKAFDAILRGNQKFDPRCYALHFPKTFLDSLSHPHLLTLLSVFQPPA